MLSSLFGWSLVCWECELILSWSVVGGFGPSLTLVLLSLSLPLSYFSSLPLFLLSLLSSSLNEFLWIWRSYSSSASSMFLKSSMLNNSSKITWTHSSTNMVLLLRIVYALCVYEYPTNTLSSILISNFQRLFFPLFKDKALVSKGPYIPPFGFPIIQQFIGSFVYHLPDETPASYIVGSVNSLSLEIFGITKIYQHYSCYIHQGSVLSYHNIILLGSSRCVEVVTSKSTLFINFI